MGWALAFFAVWFAVAGGNLAFHMIRKDWDDRSDMLTAVLFAAGPVLGTVLLLTV
jgi:hypothetical protein